MPRNLLRRFLADSRAIREHRLLGWLGPALHHPRIWHVSRQGISLGVAIGIFFGLMVPIAQVPAAAIAAVTLRANLPAATISTLITNPLTFAPIYYLAYRIGVLLLGAADQAVANDSELDASVGQLSGWLAAWNQHVVRLGKPLILGVFVLAASLSVVSYLTVSGLWRAFTRSGG